MTTALQPAYLRNVVFEVGQPTYATIQNMRISFDVRQDVEGTADPSIVRIYNLSTATATAMLNKWTYVRVLAGYGQNRDVALAGQILETNERPEGVDRITEMLITLTSNSTKTLTKMARSYPGAVRLHNIISDVVAQMGLQIGPLAIVPNEVVKDFSFSGQASRALDRLLLGRGITWYQDGGAIFFSTRGIPAAALPEFTLNERNGMIGSPTKTDEGCKARMLLSGRVTLNQVVNIQSSLIKGRFKITSIRHQGDNWNGPFMTQFEAVTATAGNSPNADPFI